MLHVFASGNNCPAGIRVTPGGFAKNGMSVGAIDANGNPQSFTCTWSSTMVPLIYMIGVNVMSAAAEPLDGSIHIGFSAKTGR
jgi:hypothetical protein